MALNANHIFEDVGDVKCSIVEKNCSQERVNFLKELLEFNAYKVIVGNSPPPKTAPKPVEGAEDTPPAPQTFTVGVTDLSFNVVNAVYNRELKTKDGKIVGPDFWKQKDAEVKEKWYWEK